GRHRSSLDQLVAPEPHRLYLKPRRGSLTASVAPSRSSNSVPAPAGVSGGYGCAMGGWTATALSHRVSGRKAVPTPQIVMLAGDSARGTGRTPQADPAR